MKKHWSCLRQSYAKGRCWPEVAAALEPLYRRQWHEFDRLLEESTRRLLDLLRIETPMRRSSGLDVGGTKGERILRLCRAVGADAYVSGPFGRDYLDAESFRRAGIELLFHDYKHPEYEQLHGDFTPCLSVVDLLANYGEESRRILSAGQEFSHV